MRTAVAVDRMPVLHAGMFALCSCPVAVVAGNFFFAGARTFFHSLEAAIFLFSRVARIPQGSSVMPVISTEERITLGAVLSNGTVIRGQNQISHPTIAGTMCACDPLVHFP